MDTLNMSLYHSHQITGMAVENHRSAYATTSYNPGLVPHAPPPSRQPPRSFTPNPKRRRSLTAPTSNKKDDPDHIPRPSNSFMLFRKHFVANRPEGYQSPENTSLSKQAADAWRSLLPSEKKKWSKKAHEVSVEHARRNPTWKYQPTRKSDKRKEEKKVEGKKIEKYERQGRIMSFQAPVSPPTHLQNNSVSPNLVYRKASLRLRNWDDSVLHPTAHPAPYTHQTHLDQVPESLRRRSSSAPIPEWNPALGEFSTFPEHTHYPPSHPPTSYNPGYRLSYSGIRPGFIGTDIISHPPLNHCDSIQSSFQPLADQDDESSHMFEGYKITYIPTSHNQTPNPNTMSATWAEQQRQGALYVPPISQASSVVESLPLTDTESWDGLDIFQVAQSLDNGLAFSSPPGFYPHTSTPMDMHESNRVLSPSFTGQEFWQLPLQTNDQNRTEPGPSQPIDFSTSQSQVLDSHAIGSTDVDGAHFTGLTPLDEFFAIDMPLSGSFQQYMHHLGEPQLLFPEGFDAAQGVVSSECEDMSTRLGLSGYLPGGFNMFDELVQFSPSTTASSCSLGQGSSSPHGQQLDFDSDFKL